MIIYQYTTAFPVATALAHTFNTELVGEVGEAIAEDMLEFGCTFWLAPAVNIQTNPLSGRSFEYFSEDPYLTGAIASSLVRSVQKKKGLYVTVKHFACNSQETNRERVSSDLSERALREIYLPAFKACVEAGAGGVMTSYNKICGVYAANSYQLCTELLRCEWNFSGVVMTDWYSTRGRLADNALTIAAGGDLIMPGGVGGFKRKILKGLRSGTLKRESLYRAALNVCEAIFNSRTQAEFIDGKE